MGRVHMGPATKEMKGVLTVTNVPEGTVSISSASTQDFIEVAQKVLITHAETFKALAEHEKTVEYVYVDRPVETIVIQEKLIEVPVEKIVEIEKIVTQTVYIDKPVEVVKEVPKTVTVDRVVTVYDNTEILKLKSQNKMLLITVVIMTVLSLIGLVK